MHPSPTYKIALRCYYEVGVSHMRIAICVEAKRLRFDSLSLSVCLFTIHARKNGIQQTGSDVLTFFVSNFWFFIMPASSHNPRRINYPSATVFRNGFLNLPRSNKHACRASGGSVILNAQGRNKQSAFSSFPFLVDVYMVVFLCIHIERMTSS